jgi:hypothetical protein
VRGALLAACAWTVAPLLVGAAAVQASPGEGSGVWSAPLSLSAPGEQLPWAPVLSVAADGQALVAWNEGPPAPSFSVPLAPAAVLRANAPHERSWSSATRLAAAREHTCPGSQRSLRAIH